MKRGSLQLSINAIVVLVLAITMLGMGLAFTKGKFSELGEKIEVPEPDYPATQDDPVVLGLNEIKTRVGDSVGFSVNFYNADTTSNFFPCIICDSKASTPGTQVLVTELSVSTGDYEPFRIIFKDGTSDANSYVYSAGVKVCEVQFRDITPTGTVGDSLCTGQGDIVASKQFVLKVT